MFKGERGDNRQALDIPQTDLRITGGDPKNDHVPLKVVGMGPFPLPDERKRKRRAYNEARQMMQIVDNAAKRSQ